MINKNIINKILNKYDLVEIENHIFYSYLDHKGIDFKKSSVLIKYFSNFEINQILLNDINDLSIENFNLLENYQELLIPKIDRRINGAFFTPKNIVKKIIQELKPNEKDKCVDISCGSGAFLIELIEYFSNNFNKKIKDVLKENIFGYDILNYNIRRAKILITIYALERNELIEEKDFNLITTDSLKHKWEDKFEIVIGNPPYIKFQDLDLETRTFLKSEFSTINKGTYNIYFAFFELGFNLLSSKGKLGYITPNNYFTSLSGQQLRHFFHKNNSIYKIIDFNSKKVFDVLTYTCLTFINKKNNRFIEFKKFFGGNFENFIENINSRLSKVYYNELKEKKWRLLENSDQKNIKNIENCGRKLSDLFVINVGIATLRDDLYFIDGEDKNGFYKLFDEKKYYIDNDLVKAIYKISDFKNQNECDLNKRKIIFPYKNFNQKNEVIDIQEMNKKYSSTMKYFVKIKKLLLKRFKKDIPSPYYQYGRSQGLNKFGIRLLTPTFSNKPKFLKVENKHSLYCNGYGIHYRSDQNQETIFDKTPLQNPKNIDILQRILNSKIMDYYIRTTSVTIDGGFPCYQKNFIELFTIPELSNHDLQLLDKLSETEFEKKLMEIYDVSIC